MQATAAQAQFTFRKIKHQAARFYMFLKKQKKDQAACYLYSMAALKLILASSMWTKRASLPNTELLNGNAHHKGLISMDGKDEGNRMSAILLENESQQSSVLQVI